MTKFLIFYIYCNFFVYKIYLEKIFLFDFRISNALDFNKMVVGQKINYIL